MSETTDDTPNVADELQELVKVAPNTPVPPLIGVGAIALSMALKYHDMGMVTDGALYQQYKLEGRNIRTLGLADVFETAMQIEAHLLGTEKRIAAIVVDAIEWKLEQDEQPEERSDG